MNNFIFKLVNLKGQHIGSFFTFFAGLIILAHAVVPHHHHFELTHSSEQESTCESPVQEESNEDPVTHCHAFNVLVSEKTTNSSLNRPLPEFPEFYLAGINANIEIPPLKRVTTKFYGHQAIFIKQILLTTLSLRAPPVSA
ncbi:MAG: hypothetical protein V2I54_13680 [Bacteroidales bacterium]|nr:hypothetical protein [Bacteroidales bacterium]